MDGKHIHKGVLQTHHADNKNIHTQGETNDENVEPDQAVVLCKTKLDEILLDGANEEHIKSKIDEQVDDLFTSIPDGVDMDKSRGDLQTGGDPDAVDADVYESDNERCPPFDLPDDLSIGNKNGASIYDNLKKKLDLNDPKSDWFDC